MLSKSKLKYIQTLGQKKFRDSEGLFIAEGPKLVAELLRAENVFVREVYATESWLKSNGDLSKRSLFYEINEMELERISQLNTPNQVLAVVEQFPVEMLRADKNVLTLALDDIQDPGNLGTIIRIADWFGVDQVVCSQNSADCYNPKVVQSTMGSIARVKIHYTDLHQWLKELDGFAIHAAVLDGEDITRSRIPSAGVLLVGNESRGIQESLLSLCNSRISIPRKGEAESLNAAVATGIILSHFV